MRETPDKKPAVSEAEHLLDNRKERNLTMRYLAFATFVGLLLSLSPSLAPSPAGERLHYQLAADYAAKDNGHAVLVMINGKAVFERYDNGHTATTPSHLHSATKTFWAPVVAAMIEDKLISSFDEPASETITEWKNDPRKSKITVRHLLTLTAGLVQDSVNLQGHNRPTLAPDLYKHAAGLKADKEPGESFLYGPSCFYALGELMKRKLAAKKQTPLEYLRQRILDPIGAKHGEWVHDKSGNPHTPNGAYITAREWIKFGQLLLDGGRYQGKQILRKELLRFEGSKANPGYGMTAWLNLPGGRGATPNQVSNPKDKAGWIYPNGLTDIYMAGGAGGNRLYIIPSKKMVIVRNGESPSFSDAVFLGLLFDGKAPEGAAQSARSRPL